MAVHDLTGRASPTAESDRIESPNSTIEIATPEDMLVVTESGGVTLVEISTGDPTTLLVTEPVSVDPRALGLHADDLVDVDGVTAAPILTAFVLVKGADGVLRPTSAPALAHLHWGEEIRFADVEPDVDAPPGATWVDYTTGTVYRAEGTG